MNITQEQHDTAIRAAKAQALRDFADDQDIPDEQWGDLTPGLRLAQEDRRLFCSLARRRADEIERGA